MIRRLLFGVLLCLAVASGASPSAVAAGGGALDGFRLHHVPRGLGTASDFAYEYDDVAFASRVWESRTADGWRVDLTVDVLRGDRLATAGRLHGWLVEYQDRPADEARYHRTTVRGHAGWIGRHEAFWLVRPGVAIMVRLDTARWSVCELRRTAMSVRPA